MKRYFLFALVAIVAVSSLFVSCSGSQKSEAEYYSQLSGTWYSEVNGSCKIEFASDKQEASTFENTDEEGYMQMGNYTVEVSSDTIKFKSSSATFAYTYSVDGSKFSIKKKSTSSGSYPDDLVEGSWKK